MTKTENQQPIVVQVLEGESQLPQRCMRVARAALRQLPNGLPQGWPIEVTYEYGTNGRLSVRANVPGTPQNRQMGLERDDSMSGERISHWRRVITAEGGFDAFEKILTGQELLAQATDDGERRAYDRPIPLTPRSTEADAPPIKLSDPSPGVALATEALSVIADGFQSRLAKPSLSISSSTKRLLITVMGHVIASILGLVIGYYVLCWISPEANVLHLSLPGLSAR